MKTSIIMTSYNYEKYITQAIESVISQTVEDWELIIVDDGSCDNSVNIIKTYCEKDSRIKLFMHSNNENRGLKESILLGINNANYDWIAFLESDDIWAKNYLEEKSKFINKYLNCKFVYNDVECIGDDIKIFKKKNYFTEVRSIWKDSTPQDVFNNFVTRNIVPTFSCVMCKKDVLQECNWTSICAPVLDYWLWWQIAEKYEFGFVDLKLTSWRFHSDSYLTKSSKKFRHNLQRAMFVFCIAKLFARRPDSKFKYFVKKNLLLSVLFYLALSIRDKVWTKKTEQKV